MKSNLTPFFSPSGFRIIIPSSKARKLGISVIKPTGKSERLESWIAILNDLATDIITHLLNDGVGGDVNDQPGRTEVIFDDAISDAAFDHEVRHVGTGGVDEAAEDIAVAVEFGDGFEPGSIYIV